MFMVAAFTPAAVADGAQREIESLSATGRYDKYPSIAFDPAGAAWVAWTSMDRGLDRIVVRSRLSGAWSAEQRLDAGEGTESGAQLVLDGDGALWIFWHGRRHDRWSIFARRRIGEKWGPEQLLSPPNQDALHPAAARDRDGRLWVAWEVAEPGGFSIALVTQAGGGWSAPAVIESEGLDRRPALAADPAGGVFLAWDSTRSGNYDIWLTQAQARGPAAPLLAAPEPVTRDAAIDDSPALTCASDGTLWLAWNSMRSHRSAALRTDRHSGDAFVRLRRGGRWLAPPGAVPGALSGQVSYGMTNKTAADAVDPYWHWKQTQNYPSVFLDRDQRAWIVWRTDATGAHNFDLWARVHDGRAWSPELHLTEMSPGRDEWPQAALGPDGDLHLVWEGQALPEPGQEAQFQGGDVDRYNTRANPNVVLTGTLIAPTEGWVEAEPAPAPEERFRTEELDEPILPGPEPRTAATADGRWRIFFGDPHSHSILSDAKTGLPDQLLQLARDHLGLDFAVVSDHTEMGQLQATEYAELQLTAQQFTAPGRFVSLTGWEWTAGSRYGHRVILHRDQGGPPLSSAAPEGDTIEELYAHARRHDGLMSPHHTGNATWGRWDPDATHDEALEPNFEIASWHGRFEFYGNPWAGRRQVPGHQYQDALRRGRHVGVMGASDTHHLTPGEGGLTAILAERLDRPSLFEAIRARRNYATSGARIVLEFRAAGAPMGSILEAHAPFELEVRVEGTAAIDRVEIVRNLIDRFAAIRVQQTPGRADGVFLIYEPNNPQGDRRLQTEDLRRLQFKVTEHALPPGETSYYVRVTQVDGQQAWSSPIWLH